MRNILHIVISVFTVLVTGNARADDVIMLDKIAAVVGSEILLLSEVREQAGPALKEIAKASQGADLLASRRKSKVINDTLEQMIDDALVRREAHEMKLSVTSEEIDRAIQNMARENGVDAATFSDAIRAQGLEILVYRNKLRKQILRYKVLNLRVRTRVKISEAEARRYYNDQVREVRATGSFEGAHILIRVEANARAADAGRARKRTEAILKRIDSGEEFAAVAREVSEDKATTKSGGSLGTQRTGEIPAVLDRAFLDLEVGETGGPLRTAAGYHIIRLNQREALGVQRFSEVKDRIVAQLAQDEMIRQEKIWIKELRLRTFIDVRL
ncbi:MAG: hypothetical protein GY854_09910 [Deltaproteobacteria bacterium]|nr:hypothetical protein [Deltaproteobacteria bacterium]